MHLHWIDWTIIIGYCVVAFGIGLYFARRAGRSSDDYFLAGRTLPWWLAGTSMVATTFAVDTPLLVAGQVRADGIYWNWFWWKTMLSATLCAIFFAHLWRRARVTTDAEVIELRYHGKAASSLRGVMAVYSGVLTNCITMGWVIFAMLEISHVVMGWDRVATTGVLLTIALAYTVLSGFWGVVATDLLQFILAIGGAVILAGIALYEVGGPASMVDQLNALGHGNAMKILPPMDDTPGRFALPFGIPVDLATFVLLVSAIWWAGGQGGGYEAQRLFATKNERHAMLAMLWYSFCHYVLRPWPWLIVGLASLILINQADVAKPEQAYALMMKNYLPVGLLGLMIASFLAAFMSTIDTHLNWGSSYLVTDLYQRFVRKDAPPRHYVLAARLSSVGLILLAALIAWRQQSIAGAWVYLAVLTSGIGIIHLLRWYWWRINAWAEVAALVCSLIVANANYLVAWPLHAGGILSDGAWARTQWFYSQELFAVRGLVVIVSCTAVGIAAALLTKPTDEATLLRFYRRVRPGGWWGPIARQCPDITPPHDAGRRWINWLLAAACIYAGLFGVGHVVLARPITGLALLALSAGCGALMVWRVKPEPGTDPADPAPE